MRPKIKAKFQVNEILPIALLIVTTGIGLVYGLDILGDMRDDNGTCASGFTYNSSGDTCSNATANIAPLQTHEWNASTDVITGISKFPEKLPIIVTIIIAAILIGILVRFLVIN